MKRTSRSCCSAEAYAQRGEHQWQALVRQSGSTAKLSRMAELRILRLALITRIFSIEQREGLAG